MAPFRPPTLVPVMICGCQSSSIKARQTPYLIAAARTAACQHQRLLRGFSAFHIKPSRARSRYFLKLL